MKIFAKMCVFRVCTIEQLHINSSKIKLIYGFMHHNTSYVKNVKCEIK